MVVDADPRFATATSETPSREKQELQEAASGDDFFLVEHLRFFFSNLIKMSSNAKVLNKWGCARRDM